MDWVEKEEAALDEQFARGEITAEEHTSQLQALHRDAQEQEDRQSIIDAGRGHLLRDY